MLAVAAPAELRFPVYASAKIDGIRAVIKDGIVFSRSLKPIPNDYVQTMYGHSSLDGLDGELTVGAPNAPNTMQATTSGVMSRDGAPEVTLWVFDFWNNPTMPFGERLRIMERAQSSGIFEGQTRIQLLQQELIQSNAELVSYETAMLALGYEGIMTRSPKAPYKYGRSTAKEQYLLKVKRWTDCEAVVVGYEERMHNANEATIDALGHTKRSSHKENLVPTGMLGAVVCCAEDGTTFNVGTGFSDAQRRELWEVKESLAGRLCCYKTFTATGVVNAPRFNVFKAWRDRRDM